MTQPSQHWSTGSAPCRIEWRPSRWLLAALLMLAVLAPLAVLASDLPSLISLSLAAVAAGHGLLLARREWRRPRRSLAFPGDGRLLVDGAEAVGVALQWRGPLAFLSWRDRGGRRHRLAWWPDTLPRPRRRELRLAASAVDAARTRPSVAP